MDPLTWVFHLTPGVHFHDGGPLTSADVVYTFERLLGHSKLQMGYFISELSEVVDRRQTPSAALNRSCSRGIPDGV
jgi:ABC-type transport system substrate-binding protein